jgi:hypothetical protein
MRVFAAAVGIYCFALSAFGQAQTAPPFASFWKAFQAAVVKQDGESVASSTKLPFYHRGDELDRGAFVKAFGKIFDANVRRCFATAKPKRDDGSYMVACGKGDSALLYDFEPVGGQWRFIEIHPND